MGLYSNVDAGCVGVIRARRRTHLSRENTRSGEVSIRGLGGFLGERVGGILKASRFSGNQSIKGLKAEKKVRRVKPGTTSAVLTSLKNVAQTLTIKGPLYSSSRRMRPDPKNVTAIILGGGAGTQLFPLTRRAVTPALIDIPMSNCINSGINKIFVLTQFSSASVNSYLARTYFDNGVNFGDRFLRRLKRREKQGRIGSKGQPTLFGNSNGCFEDAKNRNIENILILAGDHLYRKDYMVFVQNHVDRNTEISISYTPVGESAYSRRASAYGLVKIDNRGRITQFRENPMVSELKAMKVDTTTLGLSPQESMENQYIASMGVYVFKTHTLLKLLRDRFPTANDFGPEIIPGTVREHDVRAYIFRDYWEDIGTIKSFYDANLALTEAVPKFEFYDPKTPFFTSPRFLSPDHDRSLQGEWIKDAIITHGCFLRKCVVEHSIVGERSRLDSGVELKDTIMMGADYYQTESEIASQLAEGKAPIGIGRNTKIRNCIIDKNAKIGKNVIITNKDGVQEADKPDEGFYIRSGTTVILERATIEDGMVI